MLWARHSGRASRLQESRAEAGVVAALRTEAQRTAVQRGLEAETGLLHADSL